MTQNEQLRAFLIEHNALQQFLLTPLNGREVNTKNIFSSTFSWLNNWVKCDNIGLPKIEWSELDTLWRRETRIEERFVIDISEAKSLRLMKALGAMNV